MLSKCVSLLSKQRIHQFNFPLVSRNISGFRKLFGGKSEDPLAGSEGIHKEWEKFGDENLSNVVRRIRIHPVANPPSTFDPYLIQLHSIEDEELIDSLRESMENNEYVGLSYSPTHQAPTNAYDVMNDDHNEFIDLEELEGYERARKVSDVSDVGVGGYIESIDKTFGKTVVSFQPFEPFRIRDFGFTPLLKVNVEDLVIDWPENEEDHEILHAYSLELIQYIQEIKEHDDWVVRYHIDRILGELDEMAQDDDVPLETYYLRLLDGSCRSVLNFRPNRKGVIQTVLKETNLMTKFQIVVEEIKKELETLRIRRKITKELEEKISNQQRNYYLNEQYKIIGNELGFTTNEKEVLRSKILDNLSDKDEEHISAEVRRVIDEELNKLMSLEPQSAEYGVCRAYLEWLSVMPWGVLREEMRDIHYAEDELNKFHHGLKDLKDRVLEFIAVSLLKESIDGKILCFVGPPGTGKTSIGKSIANALGRDFYRFSVGGMNDVSEIKGHRRTYIGAMPGKIVQLMKRCQSINPVILIDEVDKIGQNSFRGDPSSALLEVLDPEQNIAFVDHYLDVPMDLSKVLFICTANSTDTIPRPLLDRMEVLRLSGYIFEEKMEIAQKYLIPRLLKENGILNYFYPKEKEETKTTKNNNGNSNNNIDEIDVEERAKEIESLMSFDHREELTNIEKEQIEKILKEHIVISDEMLGLLIKGYCREAGIRSLEKELERMFRKIALDIIRSKKETFTISTEEDLFHFLGKTKFSLEEGMYEKDEDLCVGSSIGLAWNELGGSIICIETIGEENTKTPTIQSTGRLGEVMKESVSLSYSFAKSFLSNHEEAKEYFSTHRIHLHVPEGGISKDGPSAGITIVNSLVSLATNTRVPKDIAMTGEMTLSGKILPIGGVKEKAIAAKRAGIKKIILPEENKRDLDELDDIVKKDLEFLFVKHYQDVFDICFG